jgi:hypothetical protein
MQAPTWHFLFKDMGFACKSHAPDAPLTPTNACICKQTSPLPQLNQTKTQSFATANCKRYIFCKTVARKPHYRLRSREIGGTRP